MGYALIMKTNKTPKAKWNASTPIHKTGGFDFMTKAEALEFANRENRRHNSGYVVTKIAN